MVLFVVARSLAIAVVEVVLLDIAPLLPLPLLLLVRTMTTTTRNATPWLRRINITKKLLRLLLTCACNFCALLNFYLSLPSIYPSIHPSIHLYVYKCKKSIITYVYDFLILVCLLT